MGREERVVAAVMRRADDVLTLVAGDALSFQAQANLHGVGGGSRHLLELSRICREGMKRIADAITAEVAQYDGQAMGSYRIPFAEALAAAKPKLIDIFRDYGGEAPSFGRSSPKEQRELSEALDTAITNLTDEFDLRATTPASQEASFTGEDWQFAILRHFSRVKSAHKINVLGRPPSQPGHLESELGIKLSDAQRNAVARAMSDLIRDGFLEPTYTDMADPENWLRITDEGRAALQRGALDELDLALAKLDEHFPAIRRGAWQAGMSGNPDSVRHAASSGRELLAQVLDVVAPDAEVKAQPGFVPFSEKVEVTRKMRFRHALKKRPSGVSESDLEVMLGAEEFLEPLFKKLNALTHARGVTSRDVRAYLQSTEMLLEMLLL